MTISSSARSALEVPLANGAAPVAALEPVTLNRPANRERTVLRVAVHNVYKGGNLEAMCAFLSRGRLAQAGLIMLCEVDWDMRRSQGLRLAPALAERLGMSFAYFPEYAIRTGPKDFRGVGNAILSAEPLTDVRVVPLPNLRLKYNPQKLPGGKSALAATTQVGGKAITFAVAHLHRRLDPAGRAIQMERLLSELPRGVATIVGGDLNTTTLDGNGRWALWRAVAPMILTPWRFRRPERHEPLFERMRVHGFDFEASNATRKPTHTIEQLIPPLWRPKLDWIAARGIRAVLGSAAVIAPRTSLFARRSSDHDLIVCDFSPPD